MDKFLSGCKKLSRVSCTNNTKIVHHLSLREHKSQPSPGSCCQHASRCSQLCSRCRRVQGSAASSCLCAIKTSPLCPTKPLIAGSRKRLLYTGGNLWPQQGHSRVWMENREVRIPLLKLPVMFCSTPQQKSKGPSYTTGNCVVLRDELYFTSAQLSVYVRVCVPEVCVSAWITDSVEKASHLAGWLSARPSDGLQLWH